MNRMLGLTVAATLALGAAVAQADDIRGFYLGVNIGATKLDIDKNAYDAALSDALTQSGLTALSATSSSSENDASFGAFAGYRILPYLAVEAEWLTLGTGKYEARGDVTDGTTTDTLRFDAETDSKGVAASALGIWPISRTWDVYARLGMIFATTTLTAHARNSTLSFSGQRLGRYPGHALRRRRDVPVLDPMGHAARLPALRRARRFEDDGRDERGPDRGVVGVHVPLTSSLRSPRPLDALRTERASDRGYRPTWRTLRRP